MGVNFSGLENELTDVKAGDFLMLVTPQCGLVAGFVAELRTKEVCIAHEAPFNRTDNTQGHPTTGNRFYALGKFKEYHVIVPVHAAKAWSAQDLQQSSGAEYCIVRNEIVNIRVGDLLMLAAKNNDNVGGFVYGMTPTHVLLSHESPFNKEDCTVGYFTRGDRRFQLELFNRYRIMNPYPPTGSATSKPEMRMAPVQG